MATNMNNYFDCFISISICQPFSVYVFKTIKMFFIDLNKLLKLITVPMFLWLSNAMNPDKESKTNTSNIIAQTIKIYKILDNSQL